MKTRHDRLMNTNIRDTCDITDRIGKRKVAAMGRTYNNN